MIFNIETVLDERRTVLRGTVQEFVRQMHEDHGYSINEVISELLFVSAAAVFDSAEPFKAPYMIEFGDECNGDEEDIAPDTEQFSLDDEDNRYFYSSEISKKMDELVEKLDRYNTLNRFGDLIATYEEIVKLLPEHAQAWSEYKEEYKEEYYPGPINALHKLCRAYIVTKNKNKLLSMLEIACDLQLELPMSEFDLEIFEHEHEEYVNELITIEKIYKYLELNPGHLQSQLYKDLSLVGRKARYLIEAAEQFGRLTRQRHLDNWRLYIRSE